MAPRLWLTLALWVALLVPTLALGQAVVPPDEQAVQTHLGLYLTVPAQRDEDERVQRSGERLEAWFLKPLGARPDETVCQALRWVLTGRLANSTGARGLFEALPGLQSIVLVFYEVETAVAPDGKGRYRQRRSAAPQVRVGLSRERAAMLDPKRLRATLAGPRCVPVGRRLVDEVWRRR